MSDSPVDKLSGKSAVEVRLFGSLYEFASEHGWPSPLVVGLNEECSAVELAESVGIPVDQIEGVFVDGKASPIEKGRVRPGNRVGFIPYGIPGPPRLMLGYARERRSLIPSDPPAAR